MHAAKANNRDLVDQLLQEPGQVPLHKKKQPDQFFTKSAKASCTHNDTYLHKKLSTVGGIDASDILPSSVEQGSIPAIEFLLQSGADVNYRSEYGKNLLHTACFGGRLHIVKLLYSRNAKLVYEFDNYKRSAAHYAANNGSVEILEFLLTLGLDPLCTDSNGLNLLHCACLRSQKVMVYHLINKYPNLLRSETKDGLSVLFCAAFGGNTDIFREIVYILDNFLKPDQSTNSDEMKTNSIRNPMTKTKHQQTLLHLSCKGGSLEMTKYLLGTYPGMLHEVDSEKVTPAHYAADSGNIDLLRYLINSGTDPWCRTCEEETLLHRACINGQLEMTKYLIKTYPEMLNEVDNDKGTPAHHAADSGNVDVLRYLICSGADPLWQTCDEEIILHRACFNGQLELTKYLVETYPGMLNEVDNEKGTPAHYAANSGNVDVLHYLICSGADPWCRIYEEETLLHRACFNGQLEITKYLVETYPGMLLEVDTERATPAHNAADNGNVDVLRYLICSGADPWCRTYEKETLLHRSCINGQLEMTKYLVETYPGMLNEVDNERATPAHNAADSGNVDVLSYLICSGADPWCRTCDEETLLHRACFNGQLEMTKYLVKTYPKMLHDEDNENKKAAHYAADSGNVNVLSYLIDSGTDSWCRTCDEETLLHRACVNGQLEMSKYLVETYPGMLHEVDSEKRTPVHNAAESGNIAVLSYFKSCGVDP